MALSVGSILCPDEPGVPFQMKKVDESKCVFLREMRRSLQNDVDVTKTPNHGECIRCGCAFVPVLVRFCFRYGFGDGKEAANETTKEAVNETTKKTTKKQIWRNQNEQKNGSNWD